MGYNIEISINYLKHSNITEVKRDIVNYALDYDCDHYYYLYENEDACKYKRNHCVIVVHFNSDEKDIFNCAKFLKTMKSIKDLHIESVYGDEIMCKLIYASPYYLTTMDRYQSIKYTKNKRERSLSENDKYILNSIVKYNIE
jgi:hypothetical protein